MQSAARMVYRPRTTGGDAKVRIKGDLEKQRLYSVFKNMWSRCTKPRDAAYARYGGRGIGVCDRWKDFDAFLLDMGPRPHGYMLERNDNDGPYSPENCEWKSRHEQMRNTCRNLFLTHDGKTLCITDWTRLLGLSKGMIKYRLKQAWPLALVLSSQKFNKHNRPGWEETK